jgi:hypothetical protein
MTLRIEACRLVFSGTNPRGDAFSMYEVDAVTQAGLPIKERDGTLAKLRSFHPLPKGQLVDVSVTVFNSERYGRSYTLSRRGHDAGPTSEERINNLIARVDELEKKLGSIQGAVAGLVHAAPQAAQEPRSDDVGLTFEDAPATDEGSRW